MTDLPSKKDMLAALSKAKVEIPKTASDDDIGLAYIELEASEEATKPVAGPIGNIGAPGTDGADGADGPVGQEGRYETYEDVLANADPKKGDKDPVVIDWCRRNLTKEDFELKYSDRKISV